MQSVTDIAACAPSVSEMDVDAAIAEHAATPASAPLNQAAGTPWIINSAGVPASVDAAGDAIALRTSLGTLRDYNTRAAAMSFDAATASPTSQIVLPKPAANQKAPLDVWSAVNINGYEGSRDQSVRAGVGADLAVTGAATIGLSAEREDAKSQFVTMPEQDSKMSAYVSLRPAPMLSLEARSDWQAGNAEFATVEGANAKNSFSFSPRVDHAFTLDSGTTIQPFVSYTHAFDLNASARDPEAVAQSAGAGVKYTEPNAYSLSVTTDLQGVGDKETESLSSKLQLSLPLK